MFLMRIVKGWPTFPKEVIEAPFLEAFQVRLDKALGNLL